jgi:anti-sigma regulatory factor (Ser/Thr protein kinase)
MDALSRAEFVTLALVACGCCAALVYALISVRRERTSVGEPLDPPAPPQMFSLAVPLSALLPAELPVIDGLRLSASFVPGADACGGGDFYDAFFLDDETVAVAIGDADGSGVAAAMLMNIVRQAIRGAFIDGAQPVDVLRRANRILLRSASPAVVTALVGIIDPATLQFRYACAGHAPPILAGAGGDFSVLPAPAANIALGIVPHHVTAEVSVALPVDGLLALYTDGCTAGDDAPAATQAFGEALVAARSLRPNKAAVAIDRALAGRRARSDDATILTIVPEPTLAHVDVRLPAESASAALVRCALRRFFASTPLGERRTHDALVAVDEAVSNAIEHAYGDRAHQTFAVRARYEGTACIVFVEDTGTWRDGATEPIGRGIALMRALSDECAFDRSASGTSVMLRFSLAPVIADAALHAT